MVRRNCRVGEGFTVHIHDVPVEVRVADLYQSSGRTSGVALRLTSLGRVLDRVVAPGVPLRLTSDVEIGIRGKPSMLRALVYCDAHESYIVTPLKRY